ncbi:MAG: hypothetical protein U1A78_02025 [Polyangia bacterium]
MKLPCTIRALSLASSLLISVAGCSPDEVVPDDPDATDRTPLPPLAIPAGCNPIASEHDCLLPYPSDFFLVADAKMPSGRRVQLTEAARPRTRKGEPYDFTLTHPVDGFSHHQPIVAYFTKGVSTAGVPFHTDDPAKSLLPTSKVLLLDAETGQPVPAWAEVDMNTTEPSEQALIVRSLVRLKNARRYIVALQGLNEPSRDGSAGAVLPAPAGFARIRDKRTGGDPVLEPLAARYEREIFPALARLGVERSRLQLVWDFTTSSEDVNTRDLLDLRADLLPKLEAKPPAVHISSLIEYTKAVNDSVWLRIEGTIRVPLYLESTAVGAPLHRDASGRVAQNGEAEVPFLLQVPHSANPESAAFEPARILEYGHGFFGLREEINYGFMRGYANEQRYITAAVDWWGMSEPDLDQVLADSLQKPGTAFDFVDRLQQAMANMIALSYAIKGPLTQQPELMRFGKLLYDPAKLYYYGISQGAIFGVTMLSVNPLLDRAALGVGGGPYSLMMSRSASYAELYTLLTAILPNPLAVTKFITLSQSTWDRVDPMTYAPRLLHDSYPKSPANRHVLMQIGIGDHSVNNLASHLVARAVGIPLLDPAPQPIWGLDKAAPPTDDALVVVDFNLTTLPGVYNRIPTKDETNNVHEGVRRSAKIKQQLDLFFQPSGTIQNTCSGACNPD